MHNPFKLVEKILPSIYFWFLLYKDLLSYEIFFLIQQSFPIKRGGVKRSTTKESIQQIVFQ